MWEVWEGKKDAHQEEKRFSKCPGAGNSDMSAHGQRFGRQISCSSSARSEPGSAPVRLPSINDLHSSSVNVAAPEWQVP